jgi:hypothetical protein
MQAHLFYGIALSDKQYKSWLDTQEHLTSSSSLEGLDEGRLAKSVSSIGGALAELWNSRAWDDQLLKHGCVAGKYFDLKTSQYYLAIKQSLVMTTVRECRSLGVFSPDPPDYPTKIDQAVARLETEIENLVGKRIIIPTKGQLQWHLVFYEKEMRW